MALRRMSVPCAHRACVECYRRYIGEQDDAGKEPTCLTCEANGNKVDPQIYDAAFKEILGADAHALRDERLKMRAGGLLPCPTPDCKYMV